ncbi:MAG: hypothetical protein LBH59_08480 [Planctomycetaceae bacterium]|nr:hypothetical protein [Planctomycetaceae bacterium]
MERLFKGEAYRPYRLRYKNLQRKFDTTSFREVCALKFWNDGQIDDFFINCSICKNKALLILAESSIKLKVLSNNA